MHVTTKTKRELERLSGEYWVRCQDSDDDGVVVDWYINNLLPHEMAWAHTQGHSYEPCETLALLVGLSPEPLLQTVWAYQPKRRIILILNHAYSGVSGDDWAKQNQNWIKKIAPSITFSPTDVCVSTQEATPNWVFQNLRDTLLPDQRSGRKIIVDITGAKKTMAAGAYFFAAYAGVKISYVDFDHYHKRNRRPFGYSCKIGIQPDLYQTFGIRDWARVQKLYQQCSFHGAGAEVTRLAGLMKAVESSDFFTNPQREAVEHLRMVLTALEAWDHGDYSAAWTQMKAWPASMQDSVSKAQALIEQWNAGDRDKVRDALEKLAPDFPLPRAAFWLGAQGWPSIAEQTVPQFLGQHKVFKAGARPEESFYARPDLLLTYAYDELGKIRRLIESNEDYRSALLRAASLNEVLLVARLVALFCSDRLCVNDRPRHAIPDERQVFELLIQKPSASALYQFLTGSDEVINNFRPRVSRRSDSLDTLVLDQIASGVFTEFSQLADLRNQAIHTHLSVSRPIAEAALQVAQAALQEYRDHWLCLLKQGDFFDAPWNLSWDDLCRFCGLDFLPDLSHEHGA